MNRDPVRAELRRWSVRQVVWTSLVLAGCFAGIGAIRDPGWEPLALRFLGAGAVSLIYVLSIRRFAALRNIFVLNAVPVTVIIATIGAAMIVYGLVMQAWDVVVLGFVPLLFAGATQWWESRRPARQMTV